MTNVIKTQEGKLVETDAVVEKESEAYFWWAYLHF